MPVPSNISDLSTTPANNSPAGTETPGTADDYLRTHAAFIATLNATDTAHVAAADPHPAYALETDVSATLANYAPLASPALTGTPTAPTAAASTNTTQVATTAFVQGEKPTAASQAEMEAGTEEQIRSVSPLRVAQAIAALSVSGIGYGQTWQNVAASRAFGVTYTNSTGKPIEVSVTAHSGSVALQATVGGVVLGKQYSTYNSGTPRHNVTFIVPNNTTYKVDYTGTLEYWTELR